MSRHDLTDFEWRAIKPPLPNKPRRVPRVSECRLLAGQTERRAAARNLALLTAEGREDK
jgi:transposase